MTEENQKAAKSLTRKQIAAILTATDWAQEEGVSVPVVSESRSGSQPARLEPEQAAMATSADPDEAQRTATPRRPQRSPRPRRSERSPRPRRDRRRLNLALAAISVCALVGAVVFAAVPQLATAAMHQVSAWLADDRTGSAVQVDGLTGKPNARVTTSVGGQRLIIIQDGTTVLVEDPATGKVSRIDPSQLTVSATASLSAAGMRILIGGGAGYLVSATTGTVQPINPDTLAVAGPAVAAPQLTAPLGGAQVAADGTLWVADDATGALVPIHHSSAGAPEQVSRPGHTLLVSLAGNGPVVTDTTADDVVLPSSSGASGGSVNLPAAVAGGTVLEPANTSGDMVPIAVTPGGQLILVDTAAGQGHVDTVALGAAGDRLDAPLVLGTRVYLPDETRGTLLVYDTAARRQLAPIAVGAGPGAALTAFVQDGELWVNAPDDAAALCIGANGGVLHIDKNGGLPAAPSATPQQSSPAPNPGASVGGGGGSGVGGGGQGQGRSPAAPGSTAPAGPVVIPSPPAAPPSSAAPSPSPSPSQPSSSPSSPPVSPTAPQGVTEQANGDGSITVSFTPVAVGTPTYYLENPYGTGTVQPSGGIPTGAQNDSFVVSGLACGPQYVFGVTAVFSSGSATAKASSGTFACQAPGGVSGATANISPGQIVVTWSPVAGNGGAVQYQVTWPGGSSPWQGGTSYTIGNLTDWRTYAVTVTPKNGAGQGGAETISVDLSGPSESFAIYRAYTYHLQLRQGPSSGSSALTQFPYTSPNGPGATITVTCQDVNPGSGQVNQYGLSGDVWDATSYNGKSGYVYDGYVETAVSETSPGNDTSISSPLWPC